MEANRLLQGRILSMPTSVADKIIESGDGDLALLYVSFLSGDEVADAQKRLHWSREKILVIMRRMVTLGLISEDAIPEKWPEIVIKQPTISRMDVFTAVDSEPEFRTLHKKVSEITGKNLSDSDLRELYTIYDTLAMDPAVICLLVGHMTRTIRREKKKSNAAPRMPQVRKEAALWVRKDIRTVEEAEEYIRKTEAGDTREQQILALVGIRETRPAVEREREYIDLWVEKGYSDDLIALAYEKTVEKIGERKWPYINSILEQWRSKGITSADQVATMDKPSYNSQSQGFFFKRATTIGPSEKENGGYYQPSQERLRKNEDWLDKFLAEQEEGKYGC